MQEILTEEVEQIFQEYPELDTPVGREFVGTSERTPKPYLLDITEYVRGLEIKSDYGGDDWEKRNFQTTGDRLLNDRFGSVPRHMYVIDDGKKANIALITDSMIDTIEDLGRQIKKSDKTPVYIDGESNIMVIAVSNPNYAVHHGEKANSHRNTYSGVIITRALAKEKDGVAIIKEPDEIGDKHVQSCDILSKGDITFIDVPSTKLTKEHKEFLESLGIGTMETYLDSVGHSDLLRKLFSQKFDIEPTVENIASKIQKSMLYLYDRQWNCEDQTGVILTPSTLTGQNLDYYIKYFPYYSPYANLINVESEDTTNMYLELLANGESVPVSVILYEDEASGELLFIAGSSHPDVSRFHNETCVGGHYGFENAQVLAELDADLSINTDTLIKEKHHQVGFILDLKKVNNLTLTGKVNNKFNLDEIIERYNDRKIRSGWETVVEVKKFEE
jgi:hypothetical protein